jgi:hypothetical protein
MSGGRSNPPPTSPLACGAAVVFLVLIRIQELHGARAHRPVGGFADGLPGVVGVGHHLRRRRQVDGGDLPDGGTCAVEDRCGGRECCGAGEECVEDFACAPVCENARCGDNSLDCCAAGQVCLDGVVCAAACEAGRALCGSALELCCEAGDVCVEDACVTPGEACGDDFDCLEADTYCEPTIGRCLANPEPPSTTRRSVRSPASSTTSAPIALRLLRVPPSFMEIQWLALSGVVR